MRTLERHTFFLAAPAVGIQFVFLTIPFFLKENWGPRLSLLVVGPLPLVFQAIHNNQNCYQIRFFAWLALCRLYFWRFSFLKFGLFASAACISGLSVLSNSCFGFLALCRLYFWRFSALKFAIFALCRLYFWRFSALKFILFALCRLYFWRFNALTFVIFAL